MKITALERFLEDNKPFYLNKHDRAWVVISGDVEIFHVEKDIVGKLISPRKYLYTATEGEIIFSLQSDNNIEGIQLLCISPNAKLVEVSKSQLSVLNSEQLKNKVDNWIVNITEAIFQGSVPKIYAELVPTSSAKLKYKEFAFPAKGLLWVKLKKGDINIFGQEDIHNKNKIVRSAIPVTNHFWIRAIEENTEIDILQTKEIVKDEITLMLSLKYLEEYLYEKITLLCKEEKLKNAYSLINKTNADENTISESLSKLSSIISSKKGMDVFKDIGSKNNLLDTCQIIGNKIGTKFIMPNFLDDNHQGTISKLNAISKVSNVRMRKVMLRGEWWKSENGHLLAFTKSDQKPIALIQGKGANYRIKNVEDKSSMVVTAEIANTLDPVAYMFLYSFDEQMSSVKKIILFALRGLKTDAIYIMIAACAGSLLGLLVPILSGILFDDVIPQADSGFLVEVFAILVMIAFVTAMLEIIKETLMLRVETKSNLTIQAGLMDHLLRLPVRFFRTYSAGDLTNRALGINIIRQILSNTVLTAVLSGCFSIVNLLLLFWYDTKLAWIGIFLAFLAIAFNIAIGLVKLRYDRQLADIMGDIQGFLFEFLSGISKVRITGSEKRIFSIWANKFSKLKMLGFKSGNYQNFAEVFNGSYPLLTNIFFFGFIYYVFTTASSGAATLITVGSFMAFITAFNNFMRDCLSMTFALISSLNLIPLYERVKPILEAIPETTTDSTDPGELLGNIEFNSVSFRYDDDQPLVLKDVSFQIKSGEMVAFVGPSGSGKSTILRAMLGFENPETGSIYFDGQSFESLNKDLVRRQTGVVLQNGNLMPGSIYQNIVGNSEISLEEATLAAKMAGLEEDIENMPMGMHTVISAAGSTFSGGQRQRLMIARAIVHKPRMLFMDEATSALDNRTQDIVSKSLEKLQSTRIIIAHRLSTVINADRIYVMEAGRIVEFGSYEELMQNEGLFSHLAKRQIA